jgi:predicted nucleic acid-binding protein
MSGSNLVVDTNIILYLFQGDRLIADLLNEQHIYISFITELELLSFKSLSAIEKGIVKSFISECTIIDITPGIKSMSIELRKTYALKLPDAIVAATAHFLNMPLVTADKALKRVEDLNIILVDRE